MKLTLLEIIGNTVQLLILVVLPIVLAIKYWDITLKIMKILLKFVISSTPKVIEFIIPILKFLIDAMPDDIDSRSGNNCGGANKLSAKQRHDMDSNGLSRSEAINNPRW